MSAVGEAGLGLPGRAPPELVVVACRYAAAHRERLAALFAPAETVFLEPGDRAGLARRLPGADIAIIKNVPDRRFLEQPELKWVHCNKSGLEACASPAFIDSGLRITSAAGRSAPVLAEHAPTPGRVLHHHRHAPRAHAHPSRSRR